MTPMDARPFAVEQLTSARYGIEQAMREMPALRQAVAEKMKEDIEAARPYHSALRKSKIDLVEALDSAGSALEEMEEFKLARGARILRDSVSSFKLMAVSYSKLLQVLNQFCNMLPNDEGTVGRALGRLMNHAKMGYFPTDLTHIGYLHEALDFPECCVNLLDPCCGEGYALKALAPSVNSVTYGVELSNERAEAACERLARVAMGDFFRCRISRGVFHVLFLNPPYLAIPGENVRVREEKRFLIESLPCLMQGGILIYIKMAVVDQGYLRPATKLFFYPFSNVSKSGHLCVGCNTMPRCNSLHTLSSVPAYIMSMPNNDDHFLVEQNKEQLPFRSLLARMNGKAPADYYTEVLVPREETLEDFIKIK